MARLTRKNIKVFAGDATNNGVFGSLQANNPTLSNDVEQIQSLTAWSEGWDYATETSEALPPLEEFQGVQYVTTYQQAYIMQEGMPEWAATVTYYKGSLTKKVTATGFQIYNSLTDNNTGNLLSDTDNWKLVMDSDNLYALDNNVVHLTGNETIGGAKTFTNNLIKQVNSLTYSGFHVQNTQVTKGTTPSVGAGGQYVFQDNGGLTLNHRLGGIETTYDTNGVITTRILACQPVANSTTYGSIAVIYPSSGDPYTYAPTPTDTTSTSSHQIVTVGWVNSANNNIVHKTGQETINNEKIFTANLTRARTDLTKGTNPSSPMYWGVEFTDKNGPTAANRLGLLETKLNTNGDVETYIASCLNTSGSTTQTALKIVYTKTGNKYAIAPASDVINSIVTTVAITKATDKGVLQLGNGMCLQWGTIGTSSGSSGTVNFRKEFSNKSYSLLVQYEYDGSISSSYGHCNGYRSSTQSFEYHRERNVNLCWWAIGY